MENKEKIDRIGALRAIVDNCQHATVDGAAVDMTTASVILAVHDALGTSARARFVAMPIVRMADIAWKLAARS